jgi:hypothetical protein
MRRVWPFKPLSPVLEALEWRTDVFRAKSSEQRIALRKQPRRVFSFAHFMRDQECNYARTLIRNAQGEAGFYIPDWTMADSVGAVSSGVGVSIPASLQDVYYEDRALLWESETKYEVLDITWDSNGLTADVSGTYERANIMPLLEGDCPEGLTVTRTGHNINNASIIFILSESQDIASSSYPSYRGHDVMTDCPVVAGGLEESSRFEVTTFDNGVGDIEYLRARALVEHTCQMQWLLTSREDTFDLRQWLHSRKGRQKAFWYSTRGKDLTPVSLSGTTLTVYNDILLRPAPFDVEIIGNDGVTYRRQVESASAGSPVNGRDTADLTLDSSVSATEAVKVSILHCVRFDSDRAELEHNAGGYIRLSMPCREVPVP